MGFSHVHSPDSLSDPILSQVCILEMAPSVGTMGRMYIPRTGELVRISDCQVQLADRSMVMFSG